MLRPMLIALLLPSTLAAQGVDGGARTAVERGEILQLRQILPGVENRFGGFLLDARLVRIRGGYAYELSILTREGRLIDVLADAATGTLLDRATAHDHGSRDDRRGGGGPGQGGDDDDD